MGDFTEKGQLSADWHVILAGAQGLGVGGWNAGGEGKKEKILSRRTRKMKPDNMLYKSSLQNAM